MGWCGVEVRMFNWGSDELCVFAVFLVDFRRAVRLYVSRLIFRGNLHGIRVIPHLDNFILRLCVVAGVDGVCG